MLMLCHTTSTCVLMKSAVKLLLTFFHLDFNDALTNLIFEKRHNTAPHVTKNLKI